MKSGPQAMYRGNPVSSRMLSAVRRLCGHPSTAPTAVRDQSIDRMRAPISPPPARGSVLDEGGFVAIVELRKGAPARRDSIYRRARTRIGRKGGGSGGHGYRPRHLVDLREVDRAEVPAGGVDVGPRLLRARGPGDHRRHLRVAQQPGEGELEQGVSLGGREAGELLHDIEVVVVEEAAVPAVPLVGQAGARGRG